MAKTCPPHHWLLPSQSGPVADAVCKHCGEHRDFETGEQPKRWVMPPRDPTHLPDAAFRVAGKDTTTTRGRLKSVNKVETRLKLATEVDQT